MYPTTFRTLAVAFAAGTFSIVAGALGTACSDDRSPSSATDAGVAPTSDVTPAGTAGEVAGDPAVGPASPLPTDDAAAVRDELLTLAAGASFGTGRAADMTIIEAWLAEYPAIERTLFDDQPSTATTLSSSSAFLIEDVTAPGDQAFAWAVLGTDGTCAGAVAVIAGTADGSVSDADVPTVFAPVDDLEPCTARAAIAAFTTLALDAG